mmetsp:Transcript_40747/g.49429  ORF Transcript_40747/g.49429 Transcript_40747/m.49429 type:complete len:216 (+) Transcript_40747:146-793(+)
MPILYSLIARNTAVLAEYSATTGNANAVARKILERMPSGDSRVSYSQDRHLFHVTTSDGLIYLCMADEAFGRRIPFAFLEEVQKRFSSAYGRSAHSALAYAFNKEFSRVLHQQMEYYSTNPNVDYITKVKGEIAGVKKGMVENIDKVLDRGEKLELLVDKADNLQGDAFRFKKSSTRLKQQMWLKNVKFMVMVVLGTVLVFYILLAMICSPSLDC